MFSYFHHRKCLILHLDFADLSLQALEIVMFAHFNCLLHGACFHYSCLLPSFKSPLKFLSDKENRRNGNQKFCSAEDNGLWYLH